MDDPTDNLRVQDEAQPTVTIGLPVYNGEKFLAETIESLLAQTFDDFELIISDNASTDATETICRSYARKDLRIHYIRQEKNLGGSANFNFVFLRARGRYFKWAAGDDLLAPTYLARCVQILDVHEDYVLCHSRSITIGAEGQELPNEIIRSSGAAELGGLQKIRYAPAKRFRDVLLGNGAQVFDTAVIDFYGLIRSEALLKTGLLKPHMGYEKVIMARLSLFGRFWELPERLFAYRVHVDNASSQTSAEAQQRWCSPERQGRTYPRFQYLRGYIQSAVRSGLPIGQRILCFVAIGHYLMQIRKWKRVFSEMFLDCGFGDGNEEIFRANSLTAGKAEKDSRNWAFDV